ncbi:unnamed protein product [Bursaphelenchus xylophilus]|uniref:Tyrosine-protein kinase n=1 Tax=Bursaphelenchus xylophilus TaxID=6326 RepID=A0A1I7RZU8_BURXY|nr:unnamed protein product [Bursaphelenchus xylophilus]CAG9109220.1 unnamed protein product [Bursaphelenchus xylophilus]
MSKERLSKEKVESKRRESGKKTPRSGSAETSTARSSKGKSVTGVSPCDGSVDSKEISNHLVALKYYHGMMPREEIEDLLKNDGDFLLRKTEVTKVPRISISVMYNRRIRHILISNLEGQWTIRGVKKKEISELIEHHMKQKVPVQSDGALLLNPISRPDFYMLHDDIILGDKLGSGAFGAVHKGVLKKDGKTIDVAVKLLKGAVKKRNRANFIKEAHIMYLFHHRNVVQIYGIAPQEEPLMIVLELCPGGCLRKHLQKNKDITEKRLISYVKDAVRGLCYLALRRVIHRDIAARNCLLGKEDDVKISDFGLSCQGEKFKIEKGSRVPVKWLAPETFKDGVFTSKTDVWSFGVMTWEIFNRCATEPFPKDSSKTARAKICSGKTALEIPPDTPQAMKDLMKKCWIQDPEIRPSFEELFQLLCPDEPVPIEDDKRILEGMEEITKHIEPSEYIFKNHGIF